MQLITVASFFALALGVTAQGHGGPGVHHVTKEQSGGQKACCLSHDDIHADGILSGALTEGILTPLLGSTDQACAKWQLIENLNLLGFTEQGTNGDTCGGTPAICDDEGCHPEEPEHPGH